MEGAMGHWGLYALLSGCVIRTEETGETSPSETEETACDNTVVDAFPADGATDAFFRTEVRFVLERHDDTATITVRDADGATVEGTSTASDHGVIWAGQPLEPLTTYEATLSYTCGEATTRWTTSSTGTPVEVLPSGLPFPLRLSEGHWVEPPGLGDLLASQLDGIDLIVVPSWPEGEDPHLFTASGTAAEGQDPCTETTRFDPIDWQDPVFGADASTPELLYVSAGDALLTFEAPALSGAFSPGGGRLEGGVLTGFLDVGRLGRDYGAGPQTMCELVASFGVSCIACPVSGRETCLDVRVVDLDGIQRPDRPTVPRTAEEIALDPACAP